MLAHPGPASGPHLCGTHCPALLEERCPVNPLEAEAGAQGAAVGLAEQRCPARVELKGNGKVPAEGLCRV